MANHATSRNRNRRQKLKRQYARIREEAQLQGIVPTTPEGALRSEVVDPATQEQQAFPALDRKAIRQGWNVPDELKPEVIDNLVAAVEMASADGDYKGVALNARVLLQADQTQYERDHPKETGEAKGVASVNVIQQVDLC
jgi:hypothetical protein